MKNFFTHAFPALLLMVMVGAYQFAAVAEAYSLDEFLSDPANKEAFDAFPADVQEQMRQNDAKLKASEQTVIAALPAGTTQCFDHYTFGSVEMYLEPTTLTPVSGSALQFSGSIKNENPYPLVEGTLFVKIFKAKQVSEQKSVDNGYPLVDQFIALNDIIVPANGERAASFEWNIPSNTEGGKYYAAFYFSTHERYNLAGIMFMDDVTGNQVDFEIMNSEKVAPTVAFDRNGTTIDGFEYNFSKPPRLFKKDEPVEVKVKVVNPRNESVNVPITWKLAPWGDLQDSRVLDTKQEMVTLKAKETKTLSYTVQPHDNTVSLVTVELSDRGTKSIQNIRFARDGVAETRLEFPTILNYPLEAGEAAGVFVCAHSTNMPNVSGNEITLTVTDSKNTEVFKHVYSGSIPVDMTGILGSFTPERNLANFSVTATLVRDGKTIESVTQAYRCADLQDGNCSTETSETAVGDRDNDNSPYMTLYIILILVGIVALSLIAQKIHQSGRAVPPVAPLLLLLALTLFGGVGTVEAKSDTVPFTFHNDPYGGTWESGGIASYPTCSEGSYLKGDGSALYSLEAINLNTGSVIPEGSSIAIGTPVQFKLQYDNTYDTKTVFWRRWTGGCAGSPVGAWTPNAVRSASTPLSINPPTIVVNTNAAFSCSSQTNCTVTGTGPTSVTANYSATYGRYYRDYDPMNCGRDGDGSCGGAAATEVLAFPLGARSISLAFNAFQPNQTPSAPTISGPNGGLEGQNLSFTFTATDPDSDQVRYGADWDNNGSVDSWTGYVNSGTGGSASFTWGTAGTYTFKVLAQDSKGTNSTWTPKTVTITTPPPPPAPTGLTASASATCGSGVISLSWSGVSGATQYRVLDGARVVYSGPLTSASDSGLANGSSHTYVVAAMNAAGVWSSNSAPFGPVSAAPACVVATPTASLTATKASVVVTTETFDMTAFSGGGAQSCQVQKSVNGGAYTTSPAWSDLGPSYTWNGLTESATGFVDYRMICYSGAGNSGTASAPSFVHINVTAAPAVPTWSLSAPNCTILAGQSSCVSSITWSTSMVTSPNVYQGGTSFSTAPSSLGTNRTINYGTNTFELKDGGTVLATQVATASCPPTAPWNGTICAGAAAVAPTLGFSGSPLSITSGDSSTLTWTVTGTADGCYATGPAGWTGWKSTTGSSEVVSPTVTTTYTLQCWNAGATNGPKSVTITVSGVTPPPSLPCPPYAANGCSIPSTPAGGTSAGTCDVAGGYSGSCSATCSSSGSGNWNTPITNNCTLTPPPPVTGSPTLTTTSLLVKQGTSIPLSWDTNNGNESLCTLTGGSLGGTYTPIPLVGTTVVELETGTVNQTINGKTTYTLTCPSGTTSLTIEVIPDGSET